MQSSCSRLIDLQTVEQRSQVSGKAAAFGVSPHIYAVNTKDKYIIMEKMNETIVDYMKENTRPCKEDSQY